MKKAFSEEIIVVNNNMMMKLLNPKYNKSAKRAPSNYIPQDYVETIELDDGKIWLESVMIEDDSGVLRSIRNQIISWEERENYARNWNQESSGRYNNPDITSKKNFITKQFVRYLDKRLAGEIKHAKEGTTLASVREVHKALRPKAKVSIGKFVKIRFKARLLQGQGKIIVKNPYVKCEAHLNVKGDATVYISKKFEDSKIETRVDYDVHKGRWIASVDKGITQNIRARVSSTQNDSK